MSNETNVYPINSYVEEIKEQIVETIQSFGCQPILFTGAGLSKRYMDAPSWDELLQYLSERASTIEMPLAYYKQEYGSQIRIGEIFAELYQKWAWTKGRNDYPQHLFDDGVDSKAYIKHTIATYLQSITPASKDQLNNNHTNEIKALANIKPHALITTNYDTMLEMIFPEHTPIIGQQILRGQAFSVGEIFKIHGCVTEPEGLVFTEKDYENFSKKKKFLSAKLLTFFNEHPLLFVGYRANDPNIKAILSDIDEALPEKGGVIPNVFILEWNPNFDENSRPQREKVIVTDEGRELRVNLIEASDFTWVFEAFGSNPELNNISPKILRAIIARSYNLVINDLPKTPLNADFSLLTSSIQSNESFSKLFGITSINDFSALSAKYPFSLTQVGQALGYNSWNQANALIKKIANEQGVNIKESDNRYHRRETLNNSHFSKYSQEAIDLLKKVRDDEVYQLHLN